MVVESDSKSERKLVITTMVTAVAASRVCQKNSQLVSVTSPGSVDEATRTIAMMIMTTERQSMEPSANFRRRLIFTIQRIERGMERTGESQWTGKTE